MSDFFERFFFFSEPFQWQETEGLSIGSISHIDMPLGHWVSARDSFDAWVWTDSISQPTASHMPCFGKLQAFKRLSARAVERMRSKIEPLHVRVGDIFNYP